MAAPAGTIKVRGTRNVGGHYYTHNKNRDHNVQMILMRKYNNYYYYWAHGNNTSKPHLSATAHKQKKFPRKKTGRYNTMGGYQANKAHVRKK